MTNDVFSYKEALNFGWEGVKNNLVFFIGLFLLVIGLNIVPSIVGAILQAIGGKSGSFFIVLLVFVISIIGIIIELLTSIGIFNVSLNYYDSGTVKIGDFFSKWGLIGQYVMCTLVYGVIVLIGCILLIVPGIIWSIKYQFAPLLVVDKGMGAMDAIKASGDMTSGYKWDLFIFWIVLVVINVIGALALLIGLFVTIPISWLAYIWVYRKLLNRTQGLGVI